MKPFVKWVGGKTQLLNSLLPLIPKKFNNYLEPFLGGGALFFNVAPEKAIINDINSSLIETYKSIKNNLENIIKILELMVVSHNEAKENYYLSVRKTYPKNSSEIAARFIYLNKTCFNGLYRENSRGEFNVPYNKKDFITMDSLVDLNNLTNISNYLNAKNIEIYSTDYKKIINLAKKGDFIFVDPPYDVEDNKRSFTRYNKTDFTRKNQEELAFILQEAHKKGVKWILTNHSTDFIKNLYKDFNMKEIVVNRMISSRPSNRKNATKEVIIFNYEWDNE